MECDDNEIIMYINLPYTCRICCLKSSEMEMIALQDSVDEKVKYCDLIMLCFSVNICDSENLPNFICKSCKIRLIDAYILRSMYLESDKRLKNILQSQSDQMCSNGHIKTELKETRESCNMETNVQNCVEELEDNETVNYDIVPYEVEESYDVVDNKLNIQDFEINIKSDTNIIKEIFIERLHQTDNVEPVKDVVYSNFNQDSKSNEFEKKIEQTSSQKSTRRIKKGKKNHECKICLKSFDKAYRLMRHANVHNPTNRPFECDICYYRFQSENSLIRHKIVHSNLIIEHTTLIQSPIMEYKCIECEKIFSKQESLSSHMKTHQEEMSRKEFKCDYCPKIFKKLNLLTRHARQHDELKIHQCNICFKTFALNSQLIDHINRHRGIKPHVCGICGKGFQQSCTLKDHMRIHSGEQPFLCSECGKAFNNSSNLRQHLLRHTGTKPYVCNLCPSRFSSNGLYSLNF